MKKSTLAFVAAFLSLACAGSTLVLAQPSSEIELTRSAIQAERQALVTANLGLTEDEGLAFWPVYRDYRVEMARVGDRLVKLITDYAASWEALPDAQASALVRDLLAVQQDALRVKEKFAPRFEKVISAKSVFRFYQIENKLDAFVMMGVVEQIPLVK